MQTFAAFWIFGLVNNVLYVVILSAAVDLVGPTTPKAIVLMADVLPSFLCKITSPFFIHLVPYSVRIYGLVLLSFTGMLIIWWSSNVASILGGIVLASASSGFGEITFLQLTHYYGEASLNGWASGTGGAGLFGAFVFMIFTTVLAVSPNTTLLMFSVVPFAFILTYFGLLPKPPMPKSDLVDPSEELEAVTTELNPDYQPLSNPDAPETPQSSKTLAEHMILTTRRILPYIWPYMAPLFTVYTAEYIINQGVSPTLLFPLDQMPFHHFRDAYVTYSTLYQLGVFISRSSGPFYHLDRVYVPAVLQMVNLLLIILQSLFVWLPSIYLVMLLVFYEGLLGGLSYINTFRLVTERTKLSEREFAMGCVGMSDSGGIVLAATISMFLEPALCQYQVHNGRPWCTRK